MKDIFFKTRETAWCPGCGNFSILTALKKALEKLDKKPHEVLITGGIGQAAKTPQYINANSFCGLHGRALPAAAGAKIANKNLTVIIDTGDGDSYGEGGNHFIHAIRRNLDITHFVHDNQIYGLTKGQASPTSDAGFVTGVQPMGSVMEPLNPLLMALVAGAGFVARGFSGDIEQLTFLMHQAIEYKGYALVDILQPCISFNKVNTFEWYKKRVYRLDKKYDYENKEIAFSKAAEWGDKIPTGIIFKKEKDCWNEKMMGYFNGQSLLERKFDRDRLKSFMNDFT